LTVARSTGEVVADRYIRQLTDAETLQALLGTISSEKQDYEMLLYIVQTMQAILQVSNKSHRVQEKIYDAGGVRILFEHIGRLSGAETPTAVVVDALKGFLGFVTVRQQDTIVPILV
jgi:hypothetical protein